MYGRRIRHRIGRLASSCLIAAGLSLVGAGAGLGAAQAQPAASALTYTLVAQWHAQLTSAPSRPAPNVSNAPVLISPASSRRGR
jgi:hypothetical protein